MLLFALLALTCTLRAEWVAHGPPSDAASRCSGELRIGSSLGRAGAPRTPPNLSILNSCLATRLPASDPIRIRELARSLDFDWRKCFDFVRDNILFEPYFGFLRGAERTLLDREGNDADQRIVGIDESEKPSRAPDIATHHGAAWNRRKYGWWNRSSCSSQ